jgi:hypothetical protein
VEKSNVIFREMFSAKTLQDSRQVLKYYMGEKGEINFQVIHGENRYPESRNLG